MIRVRVPATSANLGPGYDCLGLALNLYSTFESSPCDRLIIEGVSPQYQNEDNLFVKAFRAAGGTGGLHLRIHSQIPVSRGLGSSASFLVGGAMTAMMQNGTFSRKHLFELCCLLEGHPDNAAPAVYGGLTASLMKDGFCITRSLPLADSLRFTVMIPGCRVETDAARNALPDCVAHRAASENSARAVLMTQALAAGDIPLLKEAAKDCMHEPFRKPLIPEYERLAETVTQDAEGAMVISGSGSACLFISRNWLSEQCEQNLKALPGGWEVRRLSVGSGAEAVQEAEWQEII